ncbi:hypothetical protein THRCLA_03981 [Thraustotheca clavata]|uniref:Hook C-terminal domain-containing protein n=1 Tax=Thraustotheca clavata TaxID=74557 RepID=A0A1W0A0A7_9STRA|nr:hypothetical protein THRCLA_03981 [Thraustotheca clavata]
MHAKEYRLKSYLTCDYLHTLNSLKDLEHCSAQTEEELGRLLEVLCIAAFNGPQKGTFVQDIMDMDARVQERVYAVLTQASLEAESYAAEEVHSPKKTIDVDGVTMTPSPHTFNDDIPSSSRSNEMNRLIRANSILKGENQSLVQEIQALNATISALEANESHRHEEFAMLQLQMEVDKAKHERNFKEQHKILVQKLQNDLDAAEQKYQALNHVEKELAELKDEMDIVRSTADKAEKLQAQLDKYKLKIDEIPRLREANKRLETKNHELSEKVLHQTDQLQKFSNVHRKLEEAKDSLTTMAVQIRELEIAASKREEERIQLVAKVESAKQEITLQTNLKHDLQKLLDQVQTSQPLEFGAERLEIDSDMQEKLEALQLENGRLKRQLNTEAADHVEKLLDDIDSLTRVQKSFETKFITTRDALDAMTIQWNEEKENVAVLTQTNSDFQVQFTSLISEKEALIVALHESNEAAKKCEEDWTMKLAACNDANSKQVAQLSCIIEEKSFGIQNLQEAIQSLEKDVSARAAVIEELNSLNSALQSSVEKLNEQLDTSQRRLEDTTLQLTSTQNRAGDLHEKLIAEQSQNELLSTKMIVESGWKNLTQSMAN